MNTHDLQAQAALYLLGCLPPGEARTFETAATTEHREAITEMTEIVASFGIGASTPAKPPPSLRERLLARLEQRAPNGGLFSKRAQDQGPWRPTANPGVSFKKLMFDQSTGLMTMLVKMEPGARLAGHSHGRTEQCLILEGDLRYSEEKVYRAGDFTWAEAGTIDPALYSVEGNLLLIVGEP